MTSLPDRPRPAFCWRPWIHGVAIGLIVLVLGLAAWAWMRASVYDVAALARRIPRRTALMEARAREAAQRGRVAGVNRRWVSYERVSPLLRRAILVAEDDGFFQHGGLDWNEIRESARKNLERRRVVRGGSTITQQLAKNVFLGDERTLTRKLVEAFLAIRIERTLSKRRIFELYLNLIEWGDGIYGAEAAARRYFGVSASDLNARQALLLAAVIINPRRYSVLAPPKRIERRVRLIAGRLRRRGFIDEAQYAQATLAPSAVPHPPGVPLPPIFGPFVAPESTAAPGVDSASAADTGSPAEDSVGIPAP